MARKAHNFIDLVGQRFTRLVVIQRLPPNGQKARWLCQCDCGNTHEAQGTHLRKGLVPSCGCLKSEKIRKSRTKHGRSKSPIVQVWIDMHKRCCNPNCREYKNYGARGITVCDEWRDVHAFLRDMESGYKPGLELDRIDNEKGYSKENCRWTTHKTNCNNRRTNKFLEYNGERKTIVQWAESCGINKQTFYGRVVKAGWSLERVFSTPVQVKRAAKKVEQRIEA